MIFGKSIFDAADFLVSNILMPLGCLLLALFVPWKMKKAVLIEEFQQGSNNVKKWFALWLLVIRYVAPVLIIIVFVNMLGFL